MSAIRMALPGLELTAETPFRRALRTCNKEFILVGLFSGVVNLLQLTTSIYMMQIFDRVLTTRVLDTLVFLSVLAIAAVLVLILLEAVRSGIMQRIANWIEHQVAPESFVRAVESTLRGCPYRMEVLYDLGVCRSFMSSPGALSLYDLPWVLVYITVIFLLHPVMGWIALGGAFILFSLTLISEMTTSKLLRDANTAAIASQRKASAISRSAEVIDSMGMMPAVVAQWQDSVTAMSKPQQRAIDRASVLLATTRFFRLAIQIAILGVGAYLVLVQELTSGASIAGSIILSRALAPIEQMISGWKQLVQARQSFRRLQTFLVQPRLRSVGQPLPEPTGQLSVERVSYAFPGQKVAMIKGVNFSLAAGESLAIIGPSAAGKTTLLRLIIGTLPASAGAIRLDGADVYQWLREDFGRYLGYLPQDVELFDGTVFANIARMTEAAPEDVYEAATLAGCHEMILRLPNGYETETGNGGLYFSRGQRQLIGLARALFGRPKLVVLDEPNSSLDGDSEAALRRALERLKTFGTTVVLVSHCPTLVRGADKVLLLKGGAMEMFGPRAEVLRRLITQPRPAEAPTAPETDRLEGSNAAP